MKAATRVALLLLLLSAGCGGEEDAERPGPERAAPAEAAKGAPQLPAGRGRLPAGRGHILARVRAAVLVHDRPAGRPIARLRPRTPFGEPRVHAVHEMRARGRWLGIHSPVLGNGRTGWIANDGARLDLTRTRVSLRVDLAARTVALRRGARTVRRFPIAIGRAGSSTPSGRFQVTDRLPGSRFRAGAYGCCILALSARQPNLPEDWAGGDRIAIHGTRFDQTVGSASSTGCLRATDRTLRVLMRHVPAGTPVHISS